MRFPIVYKYAKASEDLLNFKHSEESEYDGKRFRPRKALEKFEKLINKFEPVQMAIRFLNSLIPDPKAMKNLPVNATERAGLGINRALMASDIAVTGFAVETNSGFDGRFIENVANVEVGFNLRGAAYQLLLNGMLSRANSSDLQPSTQVDMSKTYSVQLGFTLGAVTSADRPGIPNSSFAWQGALQIFDSVTGQPSMAYGWTGIANNPPNLGELLTLIADSGIRPSAAQATFAQPLANNSIPQQIVAYEYVTNFIGQTPSIGWPPGNGFGSTFDPIPSDQTFLPAVLT